jgi:hypothetical protein
VQEANARWPIWLAAFASVAACTAPNPRYLGVERFDAGATADHAASGARDTAPEGTVSSDAPDDDTGVHGGADGGVESPTTALDASRDDRPPTPPVDASAETSPPEPPPTLGLVAHWPLDEGQGTTAADRSGNQNDGLLVNGAAWIVGGAPIAGTNPSALRLDGADDHVDLTVSNLPRSEASQTVAVWFRNAAQAPRLRNLVALFSQSDSAGLHVGFDQAQVAAWRFGDLEPVVVSAMSPESGWHHVTYSWDGTSHRLYLDGVLVDTSTVAVRPGPVRTARLGTWQLPQEVFGGDIDEVRVYDRALSAVEIAALAARL